MIKTFSCPDTAAIFANQPSRRFANLYKIAQRKLLMLDKAAEVCDLRSPPGNMLEALKGDRTGQYSIRINDQWRLCFEFNDGNAFNVHIVDYH